MNLVGWLMVAILVVAAAKVIWDIVTEPSPERQMLDFLANRPAGRLSMEFSHRFGKQFGKLGVQRCLGQLKQRGLIREELLESSANNLYFLTEEGRAFVEEGNPR